MYHHMVYHIMLDNVYYLLNINCFPPHRPKISEKWYLISLSDRKSTLRYNLAQETI